MRPRRGRINAGPVVVVALLVIIMAGVGVYLHKQQVLLEVIDRLSADSRVAEVIVIEKTDDPYAKDRAVTLKFLEYDTRGEPLEAKFLRFPHDIIQFQALVIRFDDYYVKSGDDLKGRSAYIFTKAYTFASKGVKSIEINKAYEVPSGYRIGKRLKFFERRLWEKFWEFALDREEGDKMGIKNAQIEAPGTKFEEGILYTIRIEHDGGLRIDTSELSGILSGEKLDF